MQNNELTKRFDAELWPINPTAPKNSNKEKTFIELQYQISSKSINGEPLTFDFIKEKYQQYFDYIRKKNVGTDEKFQTKVLTIKEWLVNEKYREDYSQMVDQRDLYLYGE